MSTGPPGYPFHETVLHDVYRGQPPGVSAPAQLWTVPVSPPTRPGDPERKYPHATFGPANGFGQCPDRDHVGSTSADTADLTVQRSPQRTHVHSAGNQLYPVLGGFTRHDAQSRPFASTVVPRTLPVYALDEPNAPDACGGFSKHIGHASGMQLTTQLDIEAAPIFGFTSVNRTLEGMVSTGVMPQTSPLRLYPSQLHSRTPYSGHRMQPHPVHNETSNAESFHPQSSHSEEDFYAFLCEWTDERGHVCNMQIAGDRVSMSHHLSRHHDVSGDEKSQKPCLWRGCTETMNKGSLARHVVSRHLRAGASCGFCSKVYSRADVARRHTKKCKAANATVGNKDDVTR